MKKLSLLFLMMAMVLFADGNPLQGDVSVRNFLSHGLDKEGALSWKFSGKDARVKGTVTEFGEFQLWLHQKEGGVMELSSTSCRFLQSLREVKSSSPLIMKGNGFRASGIGYDIHLDDKVVHIRSAVTIVIQRAQFPREKMRK